MAAIGRMAVLKEWRGKGVGDALMRRLLKEAGNREIQQVTLNAQAYASRVLCQIRFSAMGNQFLEAGIPHVKMALRLADRLVDSVLTVKLRSNSDEACENRVQAGR